MSDHDTRSPKSAGAAERDVADARDDLRATLDELEGRLDPSALMDQAMAYVRGDGQRYVAAVKREAQLNPMAVALVGVGAAWLVFGALRRTERDVYVGERPIDEPVFAHEDEPAYPVARPVETDMTTTDTPVRPITPVTPVVDPKTGERY